MTSEFHIIWNQLLKDAYKRRGLPDVRLGSNPYGGCSKGDKTIEPYFSCKVRFCNSEELTGVGDTEEEAVRAALEMLRKNPNIPTLE